MDIEKLRFPIGKYAPSEIKFDGIQKWIEDITILPEQLSEELKNVDKEAKWILFYSLKELEEEMHDFPDTFTEDLHFYLKKYKANFKEFISTIQNKKK